MIICVDYIVIHSPEFDNHLATMGSLLHKITSAGFTININYCHFCRPEIKFLGYIISDCTIHQETRRIEAILSYTPPKN